MHFDVTGLEEKIAALEEETMAEDFWLDQQAAQKVLQHSTVLKNQRETYMRVERVFDDVFTYWEMAVEEKEESLESEIVGQIRKCEKDVDRLELQTLLSGKYDGHNAILSLHAGSGGVEAQDWTSMLYRMYMRYCEKQGYKTELIDMLPGDEAGTKSVTFGVEGLNAFGYLKCEKGVHRLVRISPFDSNRRRHTSFASLDVIPQVADDDELEINEDDIRIDTYRSGGAGGQHVNKTDSAVRITHIPTGIVTQCQDERSQHANKEKAMKILKAKLLDKKRQDQENELAGIRGDQQEIGWGSQIRSYVFHPYKMVKDHRTGVEVGNVDAVMDGDLEDFIFGYLKEFVKKNK